VVALATVGSGGGFCGVRSRRRFGAGSVRRHGYTVARDDDLLTMAEQLYVPVRQRRSLHNGRIATANLSSPSGPDRR